MVSQPISQKKKNNFRPIKIVSPFEYGLFILRPSTNTTLTWKLSDAFRFESNIKLIRSSRQREN